MLGEILEITDPVGRTAVNEKREKIADKEP
jgi:hypothetical protein